MHIHQVSVSYVQEQDRLLLRINGKEGGELRAWLTRRLALGLMPVLNKTAGEQMVKATSAGPSATSLEDKRQQMVTAFEKEVSLRKGDFETPYQSQAHAPADVPVGPEPLLVTEVKITQMGNGQLRVQMFEKFPGQEINRNFQVLMDAPLSNGLLQLLHQGLHQSRWLEAPVAVPAAAGQAPVILSDVADTEAAELPADAAKPKYLN
jgi:hypothetical protein